MIRCAALIPARFGSTRLPGKPLLKETGKYLVEHVYERVSAARRIDRVIVATDDERILDAVKGFGGNAVLTSSEHPSGTDRVAEAAAALSHEIILNVQGDEPDIDPNLLDELFEHLGAGEDVDMATAAVEIKDAASLASPHVVKVVLGEDGRALYFSRAPIPHGGEPGGETAPLKHIGVYAYRRRSLLRLAKLPSVPLERSEKLEQLRALFHGMSIQVLLTDSDHHGIDTPEEYAAFVDRYKESEKA